MLPAKHKGKGGERETRRDEETRTNAETTTHEYT